MTTPFNLERARAGEPIVTRNGRKAKFIAYVPDAQLFNERVVFLLDHRIKTTCADGFSYPAHENKSDLFMAEKKRTVWVNILLRPNEMECAYHYESEEDADKDATVFCGANVLRIGGKAYPVEIEE